MLIGLYLYFEYAKIEEVEIIEPDLMPVKTYVESCISIIGEKAIIQLGARAGFIEIPAEIKNDPYSYLSYIPNSPLILPYWYYNTYNRYPPLYKEEGVYSIEEQLNNYIGSNLKECLEDFKVFEKKFQIKEKEGINVDSAISEDSVSINIDYPLIIKNKVSKKVSRISKFQINIPIRLKKIYELAKKILDEENKELFLENVTIDLMAMNPSIPFDGMEFHCSKKRWYLNEIKKEVQDTLYFNIPMLRIYNTNYLPFLADESVYEKFRGYSVEDVYKGNIPSEKPPADAYEYFHYLWDIGIPKTDLIVEFRYLPNWGMNINARPSNNGVLEAEPRRGLEFLKFLCINTYHFTYDVVYPVEVSIIDNTAFNNKGFVFSFAIPVIIDHNQGNRLVLGTTRFQSQTVYSGECDYQNYGSTEYDIIVKGTDEYGYANMELSDVNISYDCFKFRCYLGKTKAEHGRYRLRTRLPSSCAHGYLIAEKQGYLSSRQQVLDDTDIDMKLIKLKTLNFKVVKHSYSNGEIGEEQTEFNNNTIVLINLQNYDYNELYSYREYPFNPNFDNELRTIKLAETNTKYSLNIMFYDNVDDVFIGGYKANWSINAKDLLDKNTVKFHIIEYLPKPLTEIEQYNLINFLDTNQDYKTVLKPELI
jgi:hypothetical protein